MSDRGNVETHKPSAVQTVVHTLSRPFEPLTLRRPMVLFPTAVGLQPGTPGLPSDDFLANFLTGRRTYLAVVRRGFGADFKNFQNYALRTVKTTPEVRKRLVEAVSGNEELLETLAHMMRSGVLTAQLALLVRAAEGTIFQVTRTLASGSLKCPHCKAELISRPAQWWSEQSCALGAPEYGFVDRILYDMLAVTLLPLVMRTNWDQKMQAVEHLASLCDPQAHPFRHWLDRVRREFRASDLASLATRARLMKTTPETLQRCARGEMLTVETIQELTAALAAPKPLADIGMRARVLAFLIDFVVAADTGEGSVSWGEAQAIVKARILCLVRDLRLNFVRTVRPL